MAITIETTGRRHYLIGDTYAIRDQLRSAGATWDSDRRAWWTGKRDIAERFAGAATSASASDAERTETLTDESTVIGRARYKGSEYLLVWEGRTRRGEAAKLAFLDGSRVFWADRSAVDVTKRYQEREWRGRKEPMTFGRLKRLREEYAAKEAAARDCDLRGESGAYQAEYEASRHNRAPGHELGSVTWLRHRGESIAVALVGFEPATFVSAEDAEDMGHYDRRSGWYGVAHYRAATQAEYEALQAHRHNPEGKLVDIGGGSAIASP